jgi:hypothetical protein
MQLQELSMITVKTPDGGSQRITIVDVDVHIHERPKEIAPYCDMPWRRSLEMMEEEPGRYNDIGKSMDSAASLRSSEIACLIIGRTLFIVIAALPDTIRK